MRLRLRRSRSGSADARISSKSASASAIHHPLAARAQSAVLDDLGPVAPAAAAFRITRPSHFDPLALARGHLRYDVDFGEIGKALVGQVQLQIGIEDACLEAGADHLLAPERLDALGDALAGRSDQVPFGAERLVAPGGIDFGPFEQVDRAALGIAGLPDLLAGEAEDRAHPAHKRLEDAIEDGAVGTALRRGRRVAIEAVLADVEEEGGEVVIGEGGD